MTKEQKEELTAIREAKLKAEIRLKRAKRAKICANIDRAVKVLTIIGFSIAGGMLANKASKKINVL